MKHLVFPLLDAIELPTAVLSPLSESLNNSI